jgi:serine/threonine protein kinase
VTYPQRPTTAGTSLPCGTARYQPEDTLSLVGTPAYMAPEQFSLEAMTEASDWYAVGVMLYEALTGRLPYEGTLLELCAKKQSSDVVPPSHVMGEVPADLEGICLGLLQRDPRRRLSGADLRQRLAAPAGAPRTAEPQGHVPPTSGVEFVGRTRELAAAHAAFVNTRAGRPQIVHVSGASGIGKTAFVRQFIDGIDQVRSAMGPRSRGALAGRRRLLSGRPRPGRSATCRG